MQDEEDNMPIYMRYEGIKGDATAAGYQGMIQLNYFAFRVWRDIRSTVSSPARSAMAMTWR
ncbi:MAG: hypothetical protein HY080_01885 [Gammaproteobacteria bacterium]|nr:hypothetical protein [Gammaproteobacteria bacterium]